MTSLAANLYWNRFVEWLRRRGNLNLESLTSDIQDQLTVKVDKQRTWATEGHPSPALDEEKLFQLMIIRYGLIEASVVDPQGRAELKDVQQQIQSHFPNIWSARMTNFDEAVLKLLCGKVDALTSGKESIYRRKADMVIDACKPSRVGVLVYQQDIRGPRYEIREGGSPATGTELYKETLKASNTALAVGSLLRRELDLYSKALKQAAHGQTVRPAPNHEIESEFSTADLIQAGTLR